MILAPDGSPAAPAIVPLSARQVTWFIDSAAFLRHLGDLTHLKIAAYCAQCYEQGLPEDVSATYSAETRSWTVSCACADYPRIADRGAGGLVMERLTPQTGAIQRIPVSETSTLLMLLGWGLKCCGGDCARLGLHDGVEGNNDPQARTLHVRCGCTDRIYAAPAAS